MRPGEAVASIVGLDTAADATTGIDAYGKVGGADRFAWAESRANDDPRYVLQQ